MDNETKQLIEDYNNWLEKINSPEFQQKNEKWLERFWEILRDYTFGLVDEDAFDELDDIDKTL